MIMLSFIKVFFQGILYVLLSPVLLVVLILNLIYAIFVYFVYEFKAIFLFFRGVSYKSEDEETRLLKEIKNQMASTNMNNNVNYNNVNNVNNSPIANQPNVNSGGEQ